MGESRRRATAAAFLAAGLAGCAPAQSTTHVSANRGLSPLQQGSFLGGSGVGPTFGASATATNPNQSVVVGLSALRPLPQGGVWSPPVQVLGSQPSRISCPTADFCVLMTEAGQASEFDGSSWNTPHPAFTLPAGLANAAIGKLSCTQEHFCVITAGGYVALYDKGLWKQLPQPLATLPPPSTTDPRVILLSCASPTMCMAALSGQSATATVGFDGTLWSPTSPSGLTGLGNIDCFAGVGCFASDDHGAVSLYAGGTWSQPTTLDSSVSGSLNYLAFDCAGTAICVAGSHTGSVVTFNPATATWGTPLRLFASAVSDLSCASSHFCAATDANGSVSFYDGSHWTDPAPAPTSLVVTLLKCPSAHFCLGQGNDAGAVLYDGAKWVDFYTPFDNSANTATGQGVLAAVTCPTPVACMAVDSAGDAAEWIKKG